MTDEQKEKLIRSIAFQMQYGMVLNLKAMAVPAEEVSFVLIEDDEEPGHLKVVLKNEHVVYVDQAWFEEEESE